MGWLIVRAPKAIRKQRWEQILLILIAALIAFAPLGVFFLRNPETFTTRITQVAAPSGQHALNGIWRCVLALAQPGKGETYVRFNVPGRPLLDAVSAALGLVGLFHLCLTPSRDGAKHRWKSPTNPSAAEATSRRGRPGTLKRT